MFGYPIENELAPDLIEGVNQPELTLGVPPFVGQRVKAGNLFRIDRWRITPRLVQSVFELHKYLPVRSRTKVSLHNYYVRPVDWITPSREIGMVTSRAVKAP